MKKITILIIFSMLLSACSLFSTTPISSTPSPTLETNTPTLQVANPTTQPTRALSLTPTTAPMATAEIGKADVRAQVTTFKSGKWDVTTFEGVTTQISDWAKNLKDPVSGWSRFPNEDFATQTFKASDGLEYGMAESAFGQRGSVADFNVAAMHYRLYTGDYSLPGIDECKAGEDRDGCAIAIFNVGDVTAMFREAMLDYGFTVTGRYWNGDAMSTTVWALASNTYFNMTDASKVNPGANCSIPDGCKTVQFTWVVTSGNQVLLKAVTIIGSK